MQCLEWLKQGKKIYITGMQETGKSSILQEYRAWLHNRGKKYIVNPNLSTISAITFTFKNISPNMVVLIDHYGYPIANRFGEFVPTAKGAIVIPEINSWDYHDDYSDGSDSSDSSDKHTCSESSSGSGNNSASETEEEKRGRAPKKIENGYRIQDKLFAHLVKNIKKTKSQVAMVGYYIPEQEKAIEEAFDQCVYFSRPIINQIISDYDSSDSD